ncbi:MAG: SDR family oxidoreductase [Alphaproteobacteria bacterium]|nr:SDR family oxidoreductase [Alphaproteobacteria bacterium]
MTKPLSNRIALLTGGSRGIGFSTAVALARAGAHVVATARTPGGLEELDDAIKAVGGTATLVPLELRDYEGIARLAKALDERYGRLDILVGNAALGGSNSPLDHFEPKEWEEVYAVNVTAQWQFIRHMHPLLLRSDAARAVFLTSGGASNPRPYRGLYGSTKAALEAIVRTYAAECASTNIRANLFNPGPTRTRMRAGVMPGEDPMTLPHPDEVAATIVPLCAPECTDTGRIYDFRFRKFLTFRPPE